MNKKAAVMAEAARLFKRRKISGCVASGTRIIYFTVASVLWGGGGNKTVSQAFYS